MLMWVGMVFMSGGDVGVCEGVFLLCVCVCVRYMRYSIIYYFIDYD